MIEVTVVETGDWAEAECERSAVLAALTMGREAQKACGIWGFTPTLRFAVDGKVVRVITLRDLMR